MGELCEHGARSTEQGAARQRPRSWTFVVLILIYLDTWFVVWHGAEAAEWSVMVYYDIVPTVLLGRYDTIWYHTVPYILCCNTKICLLLRVPFFVRKNRSTVPINSLLITT